ncbi:elongation factor Ts [bacterium]|nr:elongation factor Ts [bacterium]
MADIEQIKKLRQETGVSIAECKNALEQSNGDINQAKKILREKGEKILKGREGKEAGKGIISSYIHSNGQIGTLLKLSCESDFVAKSEEFKKLAHEICLHIAASNPLFLKPEDIPETFLDGERKIYQKQLEGSGKPEKIVNQIIEGKLNKYKKEVSLLSQLWVKDQTKTIQDLINEYIAKLGEKIEIKNFSRFEI